ncbi:MAG: biotin--[acetyl-CoA-carboxylase] ligase [Bacillus sp. (in: firmicutes)]
MESEIRKQIVNAFSKAGNGFISGQEIADLTGVSRTAVWKHIKELQEEGYQLEAVRKKGYRLISVPDRLSADSIRLGLTTQIMGQSIHFSESTDSTQSIAKQLIARGINEGTVVVADEQTAGRGRMARQWISPKGSGIWMSLIIMPDIPLQQAPQLTLLTAVAAVRAIRVTTAAEPEIKWPNDLLLNGRKLAGILTEMQAEADGIHSVIIGLGLNVNQKTADFPDELQNIATSLYRETGQMYQREPIIAEFLKQFEELYGLYLQKGFLSIKALWESYASSIGNIITASTAREQITGKALGINDDGVLLLEDQAGKIHHIYSADISL